MRKLLFTISLLLTTWSIVEAQTLTLAECRAKALEHNKSLASAKVKLDKQKYEMGSYKANFFPTMKAYATDFYSTAQGDFTINGGHLPIYSYNAAAGQYVPNVTVNADGSYTLNQYADFPSQKLDWKLKNIFMGGLYVIQPIYTGGKVSTAYNMSKVGVELANENIRLTESEVIVNTDEAYILALKAKQLGDVARSYKTLLDELKKNVEAAHKHGMKTRNDVMKVQVKLIEAELNIQKADNAYRLALMNLCHVTGIPLDTYTSDSRPAVDLEPLQTPNSSLLTPHSSLSSRPEVGMLEKKTELARQQIKISKSDMLPTVAAGGTVGYAHGAELAGKRLLNDFSATVGVAVTVPLDFFGGTSNKVRSAKASYQIAQLEQQDLNEKMLLELSQASNNLEEAQSEVNLCKIALEQATENMRLSKQQYEVGFEPLSDYLESQALWQQASSNLVQAQSQLSLANTKYLKASGQL